MTNTAEAGTQAGAGRAEHCPNRDDCMGSVHRRPMHGKTPHQITDALGLVGFRNNVLTLRHDVSVWEASDDLCLTLKQAHSTLLVLEECPELPEFVRYALGGVATLTQKASAALAVLMARQPQHEATEEAAA